MLLVFSGELHAWTSSTTCRPKLMRFISLDIINDSFIKSARWQTEQINHFIWERRQRDQNITGFDWTFKFGWDGKWNSITNTQFCDSIIYRMFWSVPGEYISARKKMIYLIYSSWMRFSCRLWYWLIFHSDVYRMTERLPFSTKSPISILSAEDFWTDTYTKKILEEKMRIIMLSVEWKEERRGEERGIEKEEGKLERW